MEQHPDEVRGAEFSFSGTTVVTARNEGYLTWFDTETIEQLSELLCFDSNCSALDLDTTNGQVAVGGGRLNAILLVEKPSDTDFDRLGGSFLNAPFETFRLRLIVRDFSSDGNATRVWNANTGDIHVIQAFPPDGKRAFAIRGDGHVLGWKAADFE